MSMDTTLTTYTTSHMEGVLLHMDSFGIFGGRNWVNKYVHSSQVSRNVLTVSKNKEEFMKGNYLEEIDLLQVDVYETFIQDSSKTNLFKIVNDNEEYIFACTSPEECTKWTKELNVVSDYWTNTNKPKCTASQECEEDEFGFVKVIKMSNDMFLLTLHQYDENKKYITVKKSAICSDILHTICNDDTDGVVCHKCQQRDVYCVNPHGQIINIDKNEAVYHYYKANCKFYVGDNEKKVLVVHFDDGSFITCLVDKYISTRKILEHSLVVDRLNQIGTKNVGLIFKQGITTLCDNDDIPLLLFYDQFNKPYNNGKFLLQNTDQYEESQRKIMAINERLKREQEDINENTIKHKLEVHDISDSDSSISEEDEEVEYSLQNLVITDNIKDHDSTYSHYVSPRSSNHFLHTINDNLNFNFNHYEDAEEINTFSVKNNTIEDIVETYYSSRDTSQLNDDTIVSAIEMNVNHSTESEQINEINNTKNNYYESDINKEPVEDHEEIKSTSRTIEIPAKSFACSVCAGIINNKKPLSVRSEGLLISVIKETYSEFDYICLLGTHLRRINMVWELVDGCEIQNDDEEVYDNVSMNIIAKIGKFICIWIPRNNNNPPRWVLKRVDPDTAHTSTAINSKKVDVNTLKVHKSLQDSDEVIHKDITKSSFITKQVLSNVKKQNATKDVNEEGSIFENAKDGNEEIINPAREDESATYKISSISQLYTTRIKMLYDNVLPKGISDFRCLYTKPLQVAIVNICEHFDGVGTERQHELGDDLKTPSIGWLVRKQFCTAIARLLGIGMTNGQTMLQSLLFTKAETVSVWKLTKEFSMSYNINDFVSVIACIEKNEHLSNDDMKFRFFICELLNRRTIDGDNKTIITWLKRFRMENHKLDKYYARESFWGMRNTECFETLFEEIIQSLMVLNTITFCLHDKFEIQIDGKGKHVSFSTKRVNGLS